MRVKAFKWIVLVPKGGLCNLIVVIAVRTGRPPELLLSHARKLYSRPEQIHPLAWV